MSMWLLRVSDAPAPMADGRYTLPLGALPPLPTVETIGQIKRALRHHDETLTPESAAALAQRLHRYVAEVAREDIVLLAHSRTQAGVMEILTPAQQAEDGTFFWQVRLAAEPLRLPRHLPSSIGLHPLEKEPQLLSRAAARLGRKAGTRFMRWRWLIGVVIVLKLGAMAMHELTGK